MKLFKHAVMALAVAACASSAYATPFTISGTSFGIGGGYGINSDTLLDAVFTTSAVPATFDLAVGGTKSFTFGTVQLNETCIDQAKSCSNVGSNNETDNLGVTANFTFLAPLAGDQAFTATVTATRGTVNGDTDVDFLLHFSPQSFTFGNGGSFTLSLSDVAFRATGAIDTIATITLDRAPVVQGADVPEPASLALLGLGLLGAGVARRRKA